MFESKFFWLSIFYVFWTLAVVFVLSIYNWMNTTRYRSSEIESEEVGYAEDPTGHLVIHEFDQEVGQRSEVVPSPHVTTPGNLTG